MRSLKAKFTVMAAAGVLAGAGLIFACGKAKDALSTPPADQTQIAQEASAEAIGIATQVTDIAMLFLQGGMSIGFAPKSPAVKPLAKEISWESSMTCPRQFSLDISPDGCNPNLDAYEEGSCESLELQVGYAEGCTEALVWKEGEGSITLEVIGQSDLPANTDQGFQVTVSFSDFVEGNKSQDGELAFSVASSSTEQAGQLKIESDGYTENGEEISGYALMTYSADGTVKKGLAAGTATEANLTMEADITSNEGSESESIDIKYVITSDMSGKPGDSDSGIVTIDISGTSSEWGSMDLAGGSIQLMSQGMAIDPQCSKNPVAGTLGVKGTDENEVTYDVLLTFHSTCDGKAEVKITVEGDDLSGTYEGTIPLASAGPPPEDTILEQLFQGFSDTFEELENGLNQLGQ